MKAPLNTVCNPCPSHALNLFRVGGYALRWLPLLMFLVAGSLFAAAPANDDFANADELSGYSGSIGGSTIDATKEGGEPDHGLNQGGSSIWYVWQAPISGSVVFDTIGSTFDTTIGAYLGDEVGDLTAVGEGDELFDFFAFLGNWRVLSSESRIRISVQAGVTYHIAVDGYSEGVPVVGDVLLNWQVAERPANDNFANARVLPTDAGFLVAENAGASKEVGEPNHAGNSGGASIWFRWTPAISGTARVQTGNSLTDSIASMDTLLAVYTGASVGALTQVAANDNNGTSVRSLVNFAALSGTTYWIVVDGKNLATGVVNGKIALTWTVGIPAGNNSFASPKVLSGTCGVVKGSTFSATKEGGEPDHAGDRGGASVWFSWTAPQSGPTVFSSLGSPFYDTLMAVYTGTALNGLTEIASNDDANFPNNILYSRVEFNAIGGTTYRIALDGYRGTNAAAFQGVYSISWGSGIPSNDEAFGAEMLTGLSGSVQGCNYFATNEVNEPNHGGNGDSIWYEWTPPASGVATISLEASSLDTVLAVYTGPALDALTLVAQNDDISPTIFGSRVSFPAEQGVLYRIAVDTLSFDGVIQLDYSLSVPPTLQVNRTNGNLTINWAGPYRLQSAGALANPTSATVWTDVFGSPPVTLPINASGNQIFRTIFP